ncbi:hypothetical protein ST37_04075 [Vibrio sp. qd031]|uniref:polysaccharide pyruvyl transferase family protein n=1 Tax=Vibrio sp. qd031 TaxID=1603038 RepID=UPI000A10E4DB|nr:polysaccharide pyruvyl transferase family protein [Vibrio sp. qd031]ORT51871.1 hypothetical protein ST37_04075 [Vibrio sp. qd031]
MRNIVVLQIPNAKNNGSAMMAINSINYFNNKIDGDVNFLCDFSTSDDRDRIVEELNESINVSNLDIPQFDRGNSLVSSLFNRLKWIKEVISVMRKHDPLAILVLGGDDFSEYYSGSKIIIRLFFMYRLSLHFPVYLIGHTIGPFTSWRKKAFGILMAKCRIVTRDKPSLEHLKNDIKHNHASLGHDLAWFNLPMQNDELKKNMQNKYLLVEDDYVVFTPTALIKHYADSENDYLVAVKELIEILVRQGKNVVLMPHVFNTEKRDERWVISELEKMLSDTPCVTYIKDMLLPSECRAIVSGCTFSIACRMHAAVSTLQTGKPTIALSYSIKYAGVIGGDMKLPELVIESRNSELWKSGIVNQIVEKVDFVENNYDQLCARIEERVEDIKRDQKRIMDSIYKQIELNKGAPFDK